MIQCQASCWWNIIIPVNSGRPLHVTRRFVCGIKLYIFLFQLFELLIKSVCKNAWKSWFWVALFYIPIFLRFTFWWLNQQESHKDVNTDPHILPCFIYVMSSKDLICMDISVVDHTPAIVNISTDLLYLSLINVNNIIITPYNSIMSQFVLIT